MLQELKSQQISRAGDDRDREAGWELSESPKQGTLEQETQTQEAPADLKGSASLSGPFQE